MSVYTLILLAAFVADGKVIKETDKMVYTDLASCEEAGDTYMRAQKDRHGKNVTSGYICLPTVLKNDWI